MTVLPASEIDAALVVVAVVGAVDVGANVVCEPLDQDVVLVAAHTETVVALV